jgi:hypothetical protein
MDDHGYPPRAGAVSRVDGLVGRRGESALIDSFLEKSAAAGGALPLAGEPGLGFAVGCPLSYVPALRCASCRTSYELSLALASPAHPPTQPSSEPYDRSAPRDPKPPARTLRGRLHRSAPQAPATLPALRHACVARHLTYRRREHGSKESSDWLYPS